MPNIAYIDDDIIELNLAKEQGFNCYEPDDYQDAINRNDVIVIDMMLGSKVMLEDIVIASSHKKVVIVSGLPELRGYYTGDKLPFLHKPFTKEQVLSAV